MVAVLTDVNYKMALAIIRDLGEAGITIIACQSSNSNEDSQAEPVGFHSMYISKKIWLADMNRSTEAYINDLLEVCKEANEKYNEKCVLIPIGAKTLQLLAEEKTREKFSEVGLGIPSQAGLDFFNSKKEVANMADELCIPVPKSYVINEKDTLENFLNQVELPCVVKPNCGEKLNLKAAQRYCIVKDRNSLKEKFNYFYKLENQPPIIQEYVEGDGYGLSVLADKGEIIDLICHRRIREYPCAGGPSTCCQRQYIEILEEYAKKIIRSINYTGIAMIEFKRAKDGSFKLLEINPRVWGTYPLTRVARTKFTYNWFMLARNLVNKQQLPYAAANCKGENTKMKYVFADLRAIAGYGKSKNFKKALVGLIDLINPWVRDGVIEFRDFKASMYYIQSLFSRKHKKAD